MQSLIRRLFAVFFIVLMPAVERCLVAADGLLTTAPCEGGARQQWQVAAPKMPVLEE